MDFNLLDVWYINNLPRDSTGVYIYTPDLIRPPSLDSAIHVKSSQNATWDTKNDVPVDKAWTILFNMLVDEDTVNYENINVRNALNKLVPVTLEMGLDGKTVLVRPPAVNYLPGEKYTLYINDVRSDTGQLLSKALKMEFNTAAVAMNPISPVDL